MIFFYIFLLIALYLLLAIGFGLLLMGVGVVRRIGTWIGLGGRK